MKSLSTLLLALLLLSPGAWARDDRLKFPVQPLFDSPDAEAKLSGDVRFFFGDQSHPEPSQTYGEFRTNKKTNAFGKSDQKACEWALLSALISLHDRALREGGNAVVDIRSNYKKISNSPAPPSTSVARVLSWPGLPSSAPWSSYPDRAQAGSQSRRSGPGSSTPVHFNSLVLLNWGRTVFS